MPFSSAEGVPAGPSRRLTARQVLDVLRAAHQAPSIHNTQPWLFRVLPEGVEVLDDVRRALPASDPRGRERVVSCGAAVRNAEVALARLGWRPETVLFPHGPDDRVVARVIAGVVAPASQWTDDLYRAIWERRTHRRTFLASAQGDDVPRAVGMAVRGTGVRLVVLPRHRTAKFAELLWAAAQQQAADDERRAEILRWTRLHLADDGVHESPPPWMTDSLASGPVVVLMTDGDDRAAWARAGLALESLLLALTGEGMVAAFLNQVVQQEAVRPALAALLGEAGHPQLVLRVGRPQVDVPATPRRPLTEVTLGWPAS
jgi:hypothetical protein